MGAMVLGDAVWNIKGNSDQLKKDLDTAKANVGRSLKDMAEMGRVVGVGLTAIGASITGMAALSAKAAIDFESAFAGVRKTVDATEVEFASMRQEFRDLSKEIPVTAVELAGIGEAAGQLGVKKENIIGFTRTIADLSVATNLAGEEGATMLARFANITQMDQSQFSNLGSAIVALGNAGASTEQDIVSMGLRLAGAGQISKMTSGDIFGIANALSSVGIEAESGGSAFSKLILDMKKSVEVGGDQLKRFADVARMSVGQFKTLFEDDASSALVAFVQGLKSIDESGGSVIQTLEAMGFEDIRMRDALLRSSSAADAFAGSIKLGNDAFRENTALTEEAAKRYETTASKLILLKNTLTDLAITVGEALIPPMQSFIDIAGPILSIVKDLHEAFPTLGKVVVGLTGAVGGLALVLGPMLIMLPGIVTALELFGLAGVKTAAEVAAIGPAGAAAGTGEAAAGTAAAAATPAVAGLGVAAAGTAASLGALALAGPAAATGLLAGGGALLLTGPVVAGLGALGVSAGLLASGLLIITLGAQRASRAVGEYYEAETLAEEANGRAIDGVRALAQGLDDAGIAYDHAKVATLEATEAAKYLHDVYVANRDAVRETAAVTVQSTDLISQAMQRDLESQQRGYWGLAETVEDVYNGMAWNIMTNTTMATDAVVAETLAAIEQVNIASQYAWEAEQRRASYTPGPSGWGDYFNTGMLPGMGGGSGIDWWGGGGWQNPNSFQPGPSGFGFGPGAIDAIRANATPVELPADIAAKFPGSDFSPQPLPTREAQPAGRYTSMARGAISVNLNFSGTVDLSTEANIKKTGRALGAEVLGVIQSRGTRMTVT